MKKGIKFLICLLVVTIVPILITAFALVNVGTNKITESLKEGVVDRLQVAAEGLNQYYAWDIINTGEAAYEHDYVDSLLAENIEMTLFLEDVRYITSIKDASNPTGRNEGTKAAADIWATVKAGNDYSAENVIIDGNEYYVYYAPLRDGTNTVVGMAFAGIPESIVTEEVNEAAGIMLAVGIGIAVFFVVIFVGMGIWLAGILRKIDQGAKSLSEGDLTNTVKARSFVAEFNSLEESINLIRGNTARIVEEIQAATKDISANVGEIDQGVNIANEASGGIVTAVDEISRGSMDMAESIQNTAMSMQDIGNGIDEITSLAQDANRASKEVTEISHVAKNNLTHLIDANVSTVAVSEDVAKGINEASDAVMEISKAADVIADIASQTNLLSLNASIEAARAGEAGRGFAVVAGNIQELAAQSSKSATEIKKVIENIIQKSLNNVELANKIRESINNEGTVLKEVNQSFDDVNEQIESTAAAINEISNKSVNVNADKLKVLDEISNLSSISEENAAACQETTASMEELSATIATISNQASATNEQADVLVESVGYFKL